MSRFNTFIFDLDGTLIDTYQGILRSLNSVLDAFAVAPVDLPTLKKRVGRGLEDLIHRSVGEARLQEGIRLFRAFYDRMHLEGSFLLPGVQDTLQHLHMLEMKMAVASNKPADYSKSLLRHLQIDSFFMECCGPNKEMKPKPDPQMLRFVIDALQAAPAETLYVGDMPLDVETARNAGISVALIPTGGFAIEELRKSQPDFLLKDFRMLTSVISPQRRGDRRV
ncbi:MAG TPA: HAD family hydrolase [Acidobacteriota bacterium]|nr:HAD family hydrolase [Acidobacteriota bacterium]